MDVYIVPDADDDSLRSCDSSNNEEVDDELAGSTSRNDCGQSSSAGSSMAREMNEIEEVAREDTRMLRVWRRIVTVTMICTFGIVLTGAIVFLEKEEKRIAYQDYLLFATSAAEALERKTEEYAIVMKNMADTITVTARDGNQFPFNVMPSFEVLGGHTRELTKNDVIMWIPFVKEFQRTEWSNYTAAEIGWYDESKMIIQADIQRKNDTFIQDDGFRNYIWEGYPSVAEAPRGHPTSTFAPLWESSPPPLSISSCNYNVFEDKEINKTVHDIIHSRDAIVGKVRLSLDDLSKHFFDPEDFSTFVHSEFASSTGVLYKHPHSNHIQPVFENLDDSESEMVGFIISIITWDHFLSDLLHKDVSGIMAVLENNCDQAYTYELHGNSITYIGEGDRHDKAFDGSKINVPINLYQRNETLNATGHCVFALSIYKSDKFNLDQSASSKILICALAATMLFVFKGFIFFMYDRFVRQRNAKIVYLAARSNAIISSMFPEEVRERLFLERDEKNAGRHISGSGPKVNPSSKMTTEHQESGKNAATSVDRPNADLFLETTILFADIVGFTAWSSVREPSQVFILLETIFQAFDDIARKRRVFKVETVGDCYVAVAGLPQPRPDHAIVMARFAQDCMIKMQKLVKQLELTLGPETGDLSMRMGLHSGPVTAGVLRGDRSRFQLFGDTMNTAARMEHTGLRGKIQISQETAALLRAAGKIGWLNSRDDVVSVKGKGDMRTYWLTVSSHQSNSNSVSDRTASTASVNMDDEQNDELAEVTSSNSLDAKTKRLVQWNVEVLLRQLKQIVAHRQACSVSSSGKDSPNEDRYSKHKNTCCLDEVKEIITLPGFIEIQQEIDQDSVQVDEKVVKQLYSYMSRIAALYRNNPFHNFEHASHVTMSVGKLLSRIVAPQNLGENSCEASFLHDHTYGITSDPLTQFSCILSALIHDVDHPGVPNAQLIQEDCSLAKQYKNKSPAEQNSVDLAWIVLMEEEYKDLREVIYQTDAELIRFRQLIVNSVMATDIADRELKVLRNNRWDRAFSEAVADVNQHDTINRKATIVIEHLIQASDVAHTMQHWHVYRKWNERFFLECYQAYKNGRAEKNPADGWYEGEMGFFDYYIIPLAKKLKDCGVFGVSSDEYLNYALRNRQEWESRGQEIISEMMEMVSADEANGIQSTQTGTSSLPTTGKSLKDIDSNHITNGISGTPLPNPLRTSKAA